jgi:hypothetical protein
MTRLLPRPAAEPDHLSKNHNQEVFSKQRESMCKGFNLGMGSACKHSVSMCACVREKRVEGGGQAQQNVHAQETQQHHSQEDMPERSFPELSGEDSVCSHSQAPQTR